MNHKRERAHALMTKGYRKVLDALRAPRFVYRYCFRNQHLLSDIERKVDKKVLSNKYDEYLTTYNTLALFEWREDKIADINRGYYWRTFADTAHSGGASEQNSTHIFLEDKINSIALDSCLQTDCLKPGVEYRCSFQNILDVAPIERLLDYTTASDSKLRLHSLALRISSQRDRPINKIASYIQPLLEDSVNMYKDIHYEKLLRIAKEAKEDNGTSVKRLLVKLAEDGLLSPKLVCRNDWLIFTRP